MVYTIVIDPRAIRDIQEAIRYYDEQQAGLGKKFENTLNKHLITLEKKPFFHIRYDNVHCLPLKKFPYMVHFTVDKENNLVAIRAVLHTSRIRKTGKRESKSQERVPYIFHSPFKDTGRGSNFHFVMLPSNWFF